MISFVVLLLEHFVVLNMEGVSCNKLKTMRELFHDSDVSALMTSHSENETIIFTQVFQDVT
jgi:hypothetical protein